MSRFAAAALSIAATLLIHEREADACNSPAAVFCTNNDAELDLFGAKGDMLVLMAVTAIPAAVYDAKAIEVGARRAPLGFKIMGVIGGTVTLGLTAAYLSKYGMDDEGFGIALVGGIIGGPALIGGVVGLVAGTPSDKEAVPLTGLVRCSGPRCRGSIPVPRVAPARSGASVVVPLVDGRW